MRCVNAGMADAERIVSPKSKLMTPNSKEPRKLAPIWRALIEIGFIVFLFYSNLLMGEFTKANGQGKNLVLAINDIFTFNNLAIGIMSGLIGYIVFEYLRKKV